MAHAACTFLSQHFLTESCLPGPEAERKVVQDGVGVIVVDVKTPHGGELQFVRDLKTRLPDLSVVFLSLYASQLSRNEDRQLFQNAVFFPKPFNNEAVVAAVAMLGTLQRHHGAGGRDAAETPAVPG